MLTPTRTIKPTPQPPCYVRVVWDDAWHDDEAIVEGNEETLAPFKQHMWVQTVGHLLSADEHRVIVSIDKYNAGTPAAYYRNTTSIPRSLVVEIVRLDECQ